VHRSGGVRGGVRVDVSTALAVAGYPVVVKAHRHPATSERCAEALRAARSARAAGRGARIVHGGRPARPGPPPGHRAIGVHRLGRSGRPCSTCQPPGPIHSFYGELAASPGRGDRRGGGRAGRRDRGRLLASTPRGGPVLHEAASSSYPSAAGNCGRPSPTARAAINRACSPSGSATDSRRATLDRPHGFTLWRGPVPDGAGFFAPPPARVAAGPCSRHHCPRFDDVRPDRPDRYATPAVSHARHLARVAHRQCTPARTRPRAVVEPAAARAGRLWDGTTGRVGVASGTALPLDHSRPRSARPRSSVVPRRTSPAR